MGNKGIAGIIGGVILGLIVLVSALGSFYTIDEGERGVMLRNGAVIGTAEPGLGWKVPFIDTVVRISTQTLTMNYPQLQAYSRDQQPADIKASVTFAVPAGDIEQLYSQYGTIENMVNRTISRQLPNQVENIFGAYTAVKVVQERAKFVQDINAALKNNVSGPVFIESVQIENIDFSAAYEKSVEDRMLAEVEVQKVEQNENRDVVQARITVLNNQATADSKLALAKAEAEAIILKGNAEATAIRERAKALAQNQNLVELVRAERWDGKLPTHVLPNQSVPFLNTGK